MLEKLIVSFACHVAIIRNYRNIHRMFMDRHETERREQILAEVKRLKGIC